MKLPAIDRQLHDVERGFVVGIGRKSLRRIRDHRRDATPALLVVGEPANGIPLGFSRCLSGAQCRPPAHRLLARELNLRKGDVIVGGQVVLHDLLHDVLPDPDAKAQLADLPAGRARSERVADVAQTESALRVGCLRVEQDVELLRDVLDDDVEAGDPDIMLINDETDGGGGHAEAVSSAVCIATIVVLRMQNDTATRQPSSIKPTRDAPTIAVCSSFLLAR